MWWKSLFGGMVLAGILFSWGWYLNLATMRMLVIRSVLTATGTVVAIIVAQKLLVNFAGETSTKDISMEDVDLQQYIDTDEPSGEESEEPSSGELGDVSTDSLDQEAKDIEDEDDQPMQENLEETVEQGDEEGVEQIADLISDSMNTSNG